VAKNLKLCLAVLIVACVLLGTGYGLGRYSRDGDMQRLNKRYEQVVGDLAAANRAKQQATEQAARIADQLEFVAARASDAEARAGRAEERARAAEERASRLEDTLRSLAAGIQSAYDDTTAIGRLLAELGEILLGIQSGGRGSN
jgi:chromosome segregation ATPase